MLATPNLRETTVLAGVDSAGTLAAVSPTFTTPTQNAPLFSIKRHLRKTIAAPLVIGTQT